MKNRLLYFSFFIFHFSFGQAKDTLVYNTGIKRAVKIVLVGKEISYTITPGEKIQYVSPSKVNYIKYSDGVLYTVYPPNHSPEPIKDTTFKFFSVTTDLLQYFLLQPNVGIEFRVLPLFNVGSNFGLVYPSPLFTVNPLANGQFTYPGTVYSGYALRVYVKLFISRKQKGFFSFQGVYKSLHFNNLSCSDMYGDAYGNTYNLNEQTTTIGLDILYGTQLTKIDNTVDVNMFFGWGIHNRNRNYTVTNQAFGNFGQPPPYESQGRPIAYNGNYSESLVLFTPVLGLRFGFSYVKKK